jgi:pimeloyl-ACP methyl ester carboxylesterase
VNQGRIHLARLFPSLDARAKVPSEAGNDGRAAILVAPCDGARSVLITFGGNAGYLVLPPVVQQLPNTHIIAIRDPKRCFSLCGVAGLGETYQASRDNLRFLLASLGGTDVHCLGVSAGGYAALRFGLDLGAHAVLGMSAPTTLDLADEPGATLKRYPYLTALYRSLPDISLDMARLYASTSPRPRVLLLYAPSHERDAWLANRMRGIPGVELEKIDEKAGHRVLQLLESTQTLEHYIRRLRSQWQFYASTARPIRNVA